ncbi:SDR family NAD(P)-dependent oxidoreductase [Flavobacterium selenitireducens]|uniref:SDR family NAD(P)-dependent oxidoreductase n=1 Tax=Flavobacterium selenitireducens TaxID=2722704 RepID=UPI00168B41A0|nr:SDR family oxidoreductase [Flavobacterium selenitireducens]MBD3581756.1 SDR family oxidoreductase [Flavobacterium selenitireducens]
MDLQLQNKTALVTGSTSGIGFATARSLLREGATVFLNGRSQKGIDTAIERLKQENPDARVDGIACDFSKKDEIDALLHRLPQVDILVNNVGIFEPVPFADIEDEDWFRFFEVNVMSGVRLSRRYFPKMLEQNWGRIIFVSSESALNIPQEMIHYGMTKTAQLAISRGLAQLTKASGVTVNSVLPGPTASEGLTDFIDLDEDNRAKKEKEFFDHDRPTSLLRRFAEPEEIASMIVYLASPLASATNGTSVRVDGGLVTTIA